MGVSDLRRVWEVQEGWVGMAVGMGFVDMALMCFPCKFFFFVCVCLFSGEDQNHCDMNCI